MQIQRLIPVAIGCRPDFAPPPRCLLGGHAALRGADWPRGLPVSARPFRVSARRRAQHEAGDAVRQRQRPQREGEAGLGVARGGSRSSRAPCPALPSPQPPGAAGPAPRGARGERGAGSPLTACGGNREGIATGGDLSRVEALRGFRESRPAAPVRHSLWDEGSGGRLTLRGGTLGIIAIV